MRKPQKQETANALAPPAAQLCYCSLVSAMLSSRCPRVLTPAVPRRPFIMSTCLTLYKVFELYSLTDLSYTVDDLVIYASACLLL